MTRILDRILSLFGVDRTPRPPRRFKAENPPDWIVDLQSRWRPHGGRSSIQVLLNKDPASGHTVIHYWPPRGDYGKRKRRLTRVLTTGEVDEILAMLDAFFPTKVLTVRSLCFDGIPSTLTVYRREPYLAIVAECNMGDWHPQVTEIIHPGEEIPPVARIGQLLLDLRYD